MHFLWYKLPRKDIEQYFPVALYETLSFENSTETFSVPDYLLRQRVSEEF